MAYRVTVTLGRSTLDRDELVSEARRLGERLGSTSEVSVDAVKASIEVVTTTPAGDALEGAATTLASVGGAFAELDLDAPRSIVHVEVEHIPPPAEEHPHSEPV